MKEILDAINFFVAYYHCNNIKTTNTLKEGKWRSNTTSLLAEKAMVLTKQHVSAYLEAHHQVYKCGQ
jgi:hypothetical protein